VTKADIDGLLKFYLNERERANFEASIRTSLQALLASPHFIFKLEEAPAAVRAGQSYALNGLDLASRLSFFLWGSGPDDELIAAASRGALATPAGLEQQARRMLADRRAAALSTRFAAQWLRLQDLDKIKPDARLYPQFDANLGAAMKRETELLFDNIVRQDRDVLELLTADYTFVNERLARHYGIANVTGPAFRRVALTDINRRGIFGHGSVLTMTSVADRTSPVLRGKWVLENILGTHPPDPPPNVPPLKPNPSTGPQTMRQRMEEHRSNPACAGCHKMMDPIGFALENFDGTGKWRTREAGQKLDAAGVLVDGTPIDGIVSLRQQLVRYSPQVVRTVTERLLTYALGRGVEYDDMPVVRSIVRNAEPSNYRFSTVVLEIVKSMPFQMNRKPGA